MENADIRHLILGRKVTFKQIAKAIGISPEYLSRIMARPLSQDHRERILRAMEEIREEVK